MSKVMDIAIIGGGVSGLYTGMRLLESPKYANKSVMLFEASERLGGRLFSIQNETLGVPCELGCMRYLKSQPLFADLIETRFKLPVVPFDTGEVGRHIYHLRGQWLTPSSWEKAPYQVDARFESKNPFQILDQIIDEVKAQAPKNVEKTALKSLMKYPFEGRLQDRPLWKLGFANLITESSNDETLKLITDSGEYYAKTINWNASEAFPYSQTVGYKAKDDIEYWCLKNGFSSVVEQLHHAFLEAGGEVHQGMKLTSIEKEADYRLVFEDAFGKVSTVLCKQLILALPKQGLEKLYFSSAFNKKNLDTHLASVRKLPVVRFALLFETPWWQSAFNGLNGHMVTDLPLRHGYYFGSENPKQQSVFLSTIDMHMTDYWHPYLESSTLSSHLPEAAISEILRQLQIVHRTQTIPSPTQAFFANWSTEGYGAGFHAWQPGYQVPKTMQRVQKPFDEHEVYIVGEAFSEWQGWVEGALATAENMLTNYF